MPRRHPKLSVQYFLLTLRGSPLFGFRSCWVVVSFPVVASQMTWPKKPFKIGGWSFTNSSNFETSFSNDRGCSVISVLLNDTNDYSQSLWDGAGVDELWLPVSRNGFAKPPILKVCQWWHDDNYVNMQQKCCRNQASSRCQISDSSTLREIHPIKNMPSASHSIRWWKLSNP